MGTWRIVWQYRRGAGLLWCTIRSPNGCRYMTTKLRVDRYGWDAVSDALRDVLEILNIVHTFPGRCPRTGRQEYAHLKLPDDVYDSLRHEWVYWEDYSD